MGPIAVYIPLEQSAIDTKMIITDSESTIDMKMVHLKLLIRSKNLLHSLKWSIFEIPPMKKAKLKWARNHEKKEKLYKQYKYILAKQEPRIRSGL